MRVIKFRVWCEGKMEPAGAIDWADGLPITCNTKTRKLYQDDDHFTLMQYTSLKDRNGNDIYEGDIIRIHSILKEGSYIDVVWWDIHNAGFTTKEGGKIPRTTRVEVIGNIHQNPELLS